jgi:hypothetical protein
MFRQNIRALPGRGKSNLSAIRFPEPNAGAIEAALDSPLRSLTKYFIDEWLHRNFRLARPKTNRRIIRMMATASLPATYLFCRLNSRFL